MEIPLRASLIAWLATDPALSGELNAITEEAPSRSSLPWLSTLQPNTLKPLMPVHGRSEWLPDGSLKVTWVRRARGAWLWSDGIDVPLIEDRERYVLTYGATDNVIATWFVENTQLAITSLQIADLLATEPNGSFSVRQQGSFAVSDPLLIAIPV